MSPSAPPPTADVPSATGQPSQTTRAGLSDPSWKQLVPWWARLYGRIILGRLPVGYSFWRSLGLFRHGRMDSPPWAMEAFLRHYDAADFPRKGDGFVTLEVGPGDSLFTALMARAHGGSRTYLVDVGPFARRDLAPYRAMIRHLKDLGFPMDGLDALDSVDAILEACDARYETNGLESLRRVPDASVDFLFTNGMFPVVPRADVLPTIREFRRVLKPSGMSSHSIGLWDCLGDALNQLRFSERTWESRWIRESGVYTNRYRYSDYMRFFHEEGFHAVPTEVNRWDALPTPREAMDPAFRGLDDDDLRVYSFNVLLRPRTPGDTAEA